MLDGRSLSLEYGRRVALGPETKVRPAELSYWVGSNPCRAVVQDGLQRLPE
jgi:hypothetical protein